MGDEKTVEIILRARNLTADEIAKARASISGLGEETEKVNRKAQESSGIFGSLGGKIAAAFTIGGVMRFGQAVLENADAIVKMSDRIGDTTDAVQRLQYIGGQTSVELETMASAAAQFQNRLASGDASVLSALQAFGISVDDIKSKSLEEQLYAISDGVRTIPDPMRQTQLAMDLFGKSGSEVLPALKAHMREVGAAAATMSEDAIRAADDFGDQIEALKGQTKAWAGESIGWLGQLATKIGDLAVDAEENMGSFWRDHGENEARERTLAYVRALRELNSELARGGIKRGKDKGADTFLPTEAAPGFIGPVEDAGDRQQRQVEALEQQARAIAEAAAEAVKFEKLQQQVRQSYLDIRLAATKAWADAGEKDRARALSDINAKTKEELDLIAATERLYGRMTMGVTADILKMGIQLDTIPPKEIKIEDALGDVTRALTELAQISGGTFGGMIKDMAGVVASANTTLVSLSKIKEGQAAGGLGGAITSAGGMLGMVGGVVSGLKSAYSIGKSVVGFLGGGGPDPAVFAANDAANKQMEVLKANLLKTYGSLDKIREVSLSVGVDLVGAFGDRGSAGLAHFQGLLDQVNDRLQKQKVLQDELATSESQLEQLRQAQVPTWDRIDGLIKEYGIDLKDAGLQIQQMAATQASTKMINDFEAWTAAGGDARTMTQKMRDQVIKLVEDSRKFGTMIPENMKPIIENLKIIGDPADGLIGASGLGLLGLTDIKYGAPVKSEADIIKDGIEKLIEKIKLLVDTIAGIGQAAGKIPSTPPWSNWTNPDLNPDEQTPGGSPPPAFASGGFRDFGLGTTVRLHGLEAIIPFNRSMSAEATRAAALIASAAGGGAIAGAARQPIEIAIHNRLEVSGRVLAESVVQAAKDYKLT